MQHDIIHWSVAMTCMLHHLMRPALALAAVLTLSGCVAYPAGYYGGGYYAAPAPVVVAPVYPRYYGWGGYGRWR
jgi:hypothetical protein